MNPKEKEPTTEPIVIHELNVSEGIESQQEFEWEQESHTEQNF